MRRRFLRSWSFFTGTVFFVLAAMSNTGVVRAQQQMKEEKLTRGITVIPNGATSVYISWRMFLSDSRQISFDLYKQVAGGQLVKLNKMPIKQTTDFIDQQVDFAKNNTWLLKVSGRDATVASHNMPANNHPAPYLSIPLQRPEGGTIDGEKFEYTANDATVGDLNGDGEYEIILKWEPSNFRLPPRTGLSGNSFIDAYTLDGRLLWRIDLGKNARSGPAYTQLLVADFDGDGKAELICKVGDGTLDGQGRAIGDPSADWRNNVKDGPMYGKIVEGPEYVAAFDGETGKVIATAEYIPTRYPLDGWGGIGGNGGNDNVGSRADRYTACVAHLGGNTPSAVMVRGWYGRTVLAAWDLKNGILSSRWVFDSSEPQWKGYSGMGNHSVTVADFDADGYDEICVGAMTVDNNGNGLYTTGLRHGDALHAGDLMPLRPGLEVFGVHENEGKTVKFQTPGMAMFDGRTGEVIWKHLPGVDVGRGVAADIDPRYPGAEYWGSGGTHRSDTGEEICSETPNSTNFLIWWDADPLRELLDRTTISKWDWSNKQTRTLFSPEGVTSNNGTKSTPTLVADILGDWREEVIWRTTDNSELRIYSTTIPAAYRLPTLMHNHQYRMAIAWQNVAYNQPPHPDFDMVTESKKWLPDQSGLSEDLFNVYWTTEGQNQITFSGDTVEISAKKGFTMWRNEKYSGNIEISYKACVMDEGREGDRLSDLNCFWMAEDPRKPDDIFNQMAWRDGVFGRYYSLNMYYFGFGGNSNTTSRFRRYDGHFEDFNKQGVRPAIIKEYTDKAHLLQPNKWYDIRIVCKGKQIAYYMDGELLAGFEDEHPYTSGWFGFRTTETRVRFTGFKTTSSDNDHMKR